MSTPGPDLASGDAATVESAGQFRIYLGAAAGVGKTYAMLSEGRRRRQRGTTSSSGLSNATAGS